MQDIELVGGYGGVLAGVLGERGTCELLQGVVLGEGVLGVYEFPGLPQQRVAGKVGGVPPESAEFGRHGVGDVGTGRADHSQRERSLLHHRLPGPTPPPRTTTNVQRRLARTQNPQRHQQTPPTLRPWKAYVGYRQSDQM